MAGSSRPIRTEPLDQGWNCKVTTTGRKSGEPRTVTVWYVYQDGTVYLTGGKDDPHWCRNLRANPKLRVEFSGKQFEGTARVIDEGPEATRVRDLFPRKYLLARLSRLFGGYSRSTPVVVTLDG